MQINPEEYQYETEQFLALFKGTQLFVSVGEGPTKSYPMTYSRAEPALRRDNEDGRAVYFTVNGCKPGSKRRKEDYTRTRAVWIDDDGDKHGTTDPTRFPIQPNIVVQSSPGKYHYYWLTDTDHGDETEAVLRGMAADYCGDPATTDRTRILRLPGYMHHGSGQAVAYTVLSDQPYSWEEIKAHFPPAKAHVREIDPNRPKFNYDNAVSEIVSGENIHENRRGIALHNANNNVPMEDTLGLLNTLVKTGIAVGSIDGKRGQERLDNMFGSVKDAYDKVAAERTGEVVELFASEKQDPYTRLSRPPGALGLFADDIMDYMQFQSWEMALVVAQHCISVFGGGMYRFKTKMAIRPRVILAETGRGKDITGRYFSEVHRNLMKGNTHVHMPEFRGSNAHTPTMIHKELYKFRVRSIILNEAGIASKSKAGDLFNLRAYLLNAASNNYKSPLTIKQMSDRENGTANEQLKPLYSALPVQLMESTPAPYVELLQKEDSFRSGEVGRQEIVFIDPHKPYINMDAEGDLDVKIINAYKVMANNMLGCSHLAGDSLNNPDFVIAVDTSEVDELCKEFSRKNIDEGNLHIGEGDYVKSAMHSRMYERIIVTMLVQAIADAAYGNVKMDTPRVTREHFHWAVEYQEELTRSLVAQTAGGSLADPLTLCVERVNKRRQDFGERSYDKKFKDRMVTRSWLTSVLDRTKVRAMEELISLRHGDRDRAMDAVIKYCEDLNILTRQTTKKPTWRLAK